MSRSVLLSTAALLLQSALALGMATASHTARATDAAASGSSWPAPGGQALGLVDYIQRIDPILLRNDVSQSGAVQTARQVLEANRDAYRQLRSEALALTPPAELRLAHSALIKAYSDSILALSRYLLAVPASAPAAQANSYLYKDAENAYAVARLVSAGCDIDVIARDAGLTMQATRSCINRSLTDPAPNNALGSPLAPLSNVTLTHAALTVNTPQGSVSIPRVRYTVGRIYAKAGQPFVFNFINDNPAPFLFNLAVYQGNDEVLRRSQLVDSTVASSGPGVLHTLTLRLRAGTYAFIDNVHPEPMRGQLIVVD